jgi:hypothetical protein
MGSPRQATIRRRRLRMAGGGLAIQFAGCLRVDGPLWLETLPVIELSSTPRYKDLHQSGDWASDCYLEFQDPGKTCR